MSFTKLTTDQKTFLETYLRGTGKTRYAVTARDVAGSRAKMFVS